MRKVLPFFGVGIGVLALLLAGCGGDDGQESRTVQTDEGEVTVTTEGDEDEGTVTISGEEGDVSATFGSDLPEGFPESLVYPGGSLVEGSTIDAPDGGTLISVVFDSDDDVDEIADFYRDRLDDLDYDKDEEIEAEGNIGLFYNKGEGGAIVTVENEAGEGGANRISVILGG